MAYSVFYQNKIMEIHNPSFSLDHTSMPQPLIPGAYQLDFFTPGSRPSEAIFRKQMRQMPNLRMKALDRPQIGQRLYALTLNLGCFIAFSRSAFFAKLSSSLSVDPDP